MEKPIAAIFDVDGTLLDTRRYIYAAFKHSISTHHGRNPTDEEITRVMGKPLTECYQLITGDEDVQLLTSTHKTFQAENLHLSEPFSNTRSTLERLKALRVRRGAVSTRTTGYLSKTLELAQIDHLLEVVIGGDHVKRFKPDPEGIFKALEVLKSEPSRTLMVGDTSVDILAGKAAGLITVGVTYGFAGRDINRYNPDYLIDDISEILYIV